MYTIFLIETIIASYQAAKHHKPCIKYCTNIAQILHKIKTVVTARQLSLSSAFIFHQNIFSWRAQPNPLTTQNI